ncbi:MAG TPA: NrfD/PsrC family molybdoenzyme membrane anchor subunit, partial [Solirubrobacteraceae bacterium]|nr:NrfD/PsrC family molybdoenzyme membrane anchor subunit [Solirubrobacteraceae bacterium]
LLASARPRAQRPAPPRPKRDAPHRRAAPVTHASGPPPEERIRRDHRDAGGSPAGDRDTTPAVGRRGGPASWRRAVEGGAVALARQAWQDARWSYLYKDDTAYRTRDGADANERIQAAARRMRGATEVPEGVEANGPFINAPVWTWEVPAYFFLGGLATGSSFVAVAADVAGDSRSAAIARKVTMAAIVPGAPLLVLDLGRPGRFLNMMRIFKPRSAMNLGAWCLMAFSTAGGAAVAADVVGRPRLAKVLGVKTALLGTYLGSYTGVLLASTAVPLWARSRVFLPPIFVCTAVATGAAANRLVLAASGVPPGHPTRNALGTIETTAMAAELALSSFNEQRLGRIGDVLEEGRPGLLFRFAKWAVRVGLLLRFTRRRFGPWEHHVASLLYLSGGLAFRFAWIEAGKASARDDAAVAATARGKATVEDRFRDGPTTARAPTSARPAPRDSRVSAAYADSVRRLSLAIERIIRR